MTDCPYCSQPGARRVLFKVRCPNAACPAYDVSMSGGRGLRTTGSLADAAAPADPTRSSRFPLDPVGLVLELAGIGLIVLWALDGWPWGVVAGPVLIVAGTILTVRRLLRGNRERTPAPPGREESPMPPAPGEPAPQTPVARGPGKPGSRIVSWILWVVAFGLYKLGQRHQEGIGFLWMLAAFFAVVAYLVGRDRPAEPEEDDETRERREAAQLERAGRRPPHPDEPFDATGDRRIEIRYRNWRDRDRTFIGDRRTLRRRGAHVSVRIEPSGGRVAFALERIANRAEVEGAIPA